MTNFNEKATIRRIIELRKDFAGERGKSKFAKALGISPSTYNYYENDRLPPMPILLKICEVTGCDIHWLLTGQHETEENALFGADNTGLSHELRRRLTALLKTNPKSQAAVLAFVDLLSENNNIKNNPVSSPAETKSERPDWIPILGRTAAGMVHFWQETNLPTPQQAIVELDELVEKHTGRTIMEFASGDVAIDLQLGPLLKALKSRSANLIQVDSQDDADGSDEAVQFVQCPEIRTLFPDAFALQIDGDSMAPRINDGDLVILSPSVPAPQGHVAVARLAGQIGVTCKLIRTCESQVHLIPINEKYETKTVSSEELLWALAVLCHIKLVNH